MHRILSTLLAALLAFPLAATARERCDPSGSDAAALAAARDAVDLACACDAAVDRGSYRRCAADAARSLLADGSLPASCRREARRYAIQSTCGSPGAVVCCQVDTGGGARHRVLRDTADCVDAHGFTSCVSEWQSVVTGCDAAGCVPPPPPVCGNFVLEAGEDCDPPSLLTCDDSCHTVVCETVPAACGNLVVEVGETCEPPGVASCGRDCQAAPCTTADAGEVDVACVEGATSVAIGGNASGYLLAWSGPHRRADEVLVRRFDANGAATDPTVTVASEELSCATRSGRPSVGSDGAGYYVAWRAYGESDEVIGAYEELIEGRRFGGAIGASATDELASNVPFGRCRSFIGGPTASSGAGTSRFAVGWHSGGGCDGALFFDEPAGAFMDFSAVPTQTAAPLGYPFMLPPTPLSAGPGTVASLAGSSLWAWHAEYYAALSSPPEFLFVAASWSDADVTTSPFELTTRHAITEGSRPSVVTGAASFLVAWSQGDSDSAIIATEIRAVRATRADGRLDADGGILLATVPAGVTSGPVAAFDGTRWLVVWTQATMTGNELRAVAVDGDGSVVDPSPRLLADDVAAIEPAAASAGDGRVLIVFTRDETTHSAVRAMLVVP